MAKHKEKSTKHKRDKKHKDKKKHKRRASSSSEEEWVEKNKSSSDDDYKSKNKKKHKRSRSSSSEEEWVERKQPSSDDDYKSEDKLQRGSLNSEDERKSQKPETSSSAQRQDWMSLSGSFLTASNLDRRREREESKRLERERNQYNPRECSRELNPYWKDGGDGLPKFKKPSEDDSYSRQDRSYKGSSSSNWRKKTAADNKEPSKEEVLTDKDLNMLAAKLVKAEIMGNTELANQLKVKLENARKAKESGQVSETEEVILTQTDSRGQVRPVRLQSDYAKGSGAKRKKQKVETHSDGQRVRYFADDDKYSLQQMFENEKFNSVEDQNSEFMRMASKIRKNDDMDEIFTDNIRKKESDSKIDARNKDKAVGEHQRVSQSLDNCRRCLQSSVMQNHLMVSMNDSAYLSLPSHEPLTDGHCLIVPIRHVPCATQLDENEWTDLMDFRKALTRMFNSKGEDVIFFESAMSLHRFPHMYIECIPLPKEEGDLAPIYFKKAIDESESEWAQNKKLISMKGKDIRSAVPKGLSYFCVSFGMEEGFAHVIEDEKSFPSNFAQEIVGGMLDLHHSKWRKPKQQRFDEQSGRVVEFSKEWKPFDCTNKS